MPLTVSFHGDGPLRSTVPSQHRFGTMTKSSFRPRTATTTQRAPATKAGPITAMRAQESSYLCDFYDNIWCNLDALEEQNQVMTRIATATGVRTTRRRRNPNKQKLIDISQVAHVLTTVLEFRSEYPQFTTERVNIWAHGYGGHSDNMSRLSEEEEQEQQSRRIVSPIQSLQRPLVPQSAPVLRASMIAEGGLLTEVDDEDEDDDDDKEDDVEPEQESPEHDDAEASFASSSFQSSGPLELKRTSSLQIIKATGKVKSKSNKKNSHATTASSRHRGGASGVGGIGGLAPPPPLSIDTAVPPPSAKNGSIIFSSVFVERLDWSWSIRFLLGIHEPIRHALYVMDRFLEQSHKEQHVETLEHHTSAFFAWFKTYFVEYVTSQNDIKLKVLHPLIKLKHSTKQEIQRTYEEIYGLLAQIQAQQHALLPPTRTTPTTQSLDRAAWLVPLDTLQKSIRRLNMTLHAVLNLEEKTLHPAMAAAFNEKTFQGYVMPRLFRAIHAKKVVIPWIVERSKVWGGEAEQQSFQGMLPMTSRFLYKKIWRPFFMSNVAVAMKNLNEFDLATTQPHREELFGCAIQ